MTFVAGPSFCNERVLSCHLFRGGKYETNPDRMPGANQHTVVHCSSIIKTHHNLIPQIFKMESKKRDQKWISKMDF